MENLLGMFLNSLDKDGGTVTPSGTWYKVVDRTLYFGRVGKAKKGLGSLLPAIMYKGMKKKVYIRKGLLKEWNQIKGKIAKLDFDTIAGYRHGAELALLAHEDFYSRYGRQPDTYIFSCPNVFFYIDKSVARARFWNVAEFTVKGDLSTRLPLFYSKPFKPIVLERRSDMPFRNFKTSLYADGIIDFMDRASK